MKISMHVDFRILKNGLSLKNGYVKSVSLGGYCFLICNKEIPFDWDNSIGNEICGVFSFDTGLSFLDKDFELSDCYDEDYKRLSVKREDITAEFLASASKINDFHIDFTTEEDEIELWNNDDDEYKIKLLKISFVDVVSGKVYNVKQDVLNAFNKL